MSFQQSIDAGLERAYDEAPRVQVDLHDLRLAILSDLHRAAGDDADDFLACQPAYHAALNHYLGEGCILAVLGDVEDLWKVHPAEVVAAHADSIRGEKPFADAGRYWRFWGNHDDHWRVPAEVERYLYPLLGQVGILTSLRLEVWQAGEPLGEVFLVHGHQGTAMADRYGWLSHWVVHNLWRPIQRLTGLRTTTPATDWRLARRHELAMYNWAVQKHGVLVIAGHTHHPIFPSPDRYEVLTALYDDLRSQPEALADEVLEQLEADLAFARSQEQPCFMNSGCCSFSDGSCTGIEIIAGDARLVRWRTKEGAPSREVLDSAPLAQLLADVAPEGEPAIIPLLPASGAGIETP